MMRRRGAGLVSLPVRCFNGRGYKIIHESPSLDVSAFVIGNFLHERDRQTFSQPAVNLAFDDHRINNVAAIIDCYKPTDFYLAGALVDVDNADVSAERKRKIRRIVVMNRLQSCFQTWWDIRVRCEGYLLNRLGLGRRALDKKFARLPFKIFFAYLEKMASDFSGFLPDFARGHGCRGSGSRR